MRSTELATDLAELGAEVQGENGPVPAMEFSGKGWEKLGGKDKERALFMTNLNSAAGEVMASRARVNRAKAELGTAETEMLKHLERYETIKGQLLKLLP